MPQILAVVTYAGVFGNVFLVAFLAAMPPDHPLPWWALATFAGLNALVHALPSDGLPMPPKVSATVVLFLALLLTGLTACSGIPAGTPPAQAIQTVLQQIQPVESAVACEAQAIANQTSAVGIVTGDAQVAAGAQLASLVAGTFCNGLAAGALLPVPVPVAGTTAVPTASGSVVLPVPAAAPTKT